ncbi:MAG: hypothetical protein K0R82_2501 [Flavipsychrobacter sp.]|jgi:hypothetical protein|nr:hypothetical protein [Flavipsychrobacter sp.]
MKIIALSILALSSYAAVAQNSNLDYKYAVKLYNLTTLADKSELYRDSNYVRTASFDKIAYPATAVQIATKKKNFHEIELSELTIARRDELTERIYLTGAEPVAGAVTTTTAIALRYEYIRMFGKKKERKLLPAIGLAAMPYYNRYRTDPAITALFPTRDNVLGIRGFIVPRLTYHISKRIYADLNVPVNLFDAQHHSTNTLNSALPAEQRTAATFNFNALPAYYSVRIGVGVKL